MKKIYRIATILILVTLGATLGSRGQTVIDYDGNVYQTVTIGDQVWMKENLKSLHYADGTAIDEVKAYNNSSSNAEIYGRLYTWDAVMKGSNQEKTQGVCPNGWHVPSNGEWNKLALHLGGFTSAGGKLKESGTEHWNSPNTGATNSSGFTALPAGEQDTEKFQLLNEYAVLWSSTVESSLWAKYFYLAYNDAELHSNVYDKSFYYSVRCIKDEATGIREQPFHGLLIYPNPFDQLIMFQQNKNSENQLTTASIFNQHGQFISEFKLESGLTTKDLHHLTPGIYYVKIKQNDKVNYQKILKR